MSRRIVRQPGWDRLLAAYIAETRWRPFAWGEHDCATWTAGAVDAMCGSTLRRDIGRYSTAAGAAAVVAGHGCTTLAGVVDVVTGWRRHVRASRAQRGDVLYLPTPNRICRDDGGLGLLCIVDGAVVRAPATERLAALPVAGVLAQPGVVAWEVPRG